MPGVDATFSEGICGGGGGGGKGDEEFEDGGGVGGAVCVGIWMEAVFLWCWILSLYASLSSFMSRRPSLLGQSVSKSALVKPRPPDTHSLAFRSSFSLYLSKTRLDCWVARNRTSCTCAHLR